MPSLWPENPADPTVFRRPAAAPSTLVPGSTLINGNYVIDAFLAGGGMGEVYRARHVHEGDAYAIKVIRPEIAKDETVVQLFRREAQALKRVNDDAIVRYRDFLIGENGAYCLIMEFVDGEPLVKVLRDRRFEPHEVLTLLRRLGQGLAAVHELGIVHRDISPENVILPGGDIAHAKLIDFGIAKSTDPSALTLIGSDFAGKLSFASPEQADPDRFDRVVDHRSDIYSLGLVLAAAALGFGKKLDMGGSLANIVRARQSVPDLGALPVSLQPLIAHMLQPHPRDRPASMRALLDEAAAGVPRPRPRSSRRCRPIWLGAAALAAGAVAVAAVLIGREAMLPPVSDVRSQFAGIVSGYSCADLSYTVGSDRTADVSGYVKSDDDLAGLHRRLAAVAGVSSLDFAVHRRIWPYCEAAAALKPLVGHGSAAATIRLAAAARHAEVGAPLLLDLRAPAFDSYVYVDYLRADGAIVHLFPNAKDWFNLRPARNRFVLGRLPMKDCWTFAGKPGEQMITLTASRHPLFAAALPAQDNAKDYLPRLKNALKRGASGDQSAAMLFYDIGPASAAAAPSGACSGG